LANEFEDMIMRGVEPLPMGFVLFVGALFALGNPFSEKVASLLNEWGVTPKRMTTISEGERRTAKLERYGARLLERTEARRAVINYLVDGQLTLLEAAQYFRTLNDSDPEHATSEFDIYEGQTEAEQFCRRVIAYASGEMKLSAPERANQVVSRLEVELSEYLARYGRVEWPARTDSAVETIAY
jgi:hypothetical protein